jgi:hypothetical protein
LSSGILSYESSPMWIRTRSHIISTYLCQDLFLYSLSAEDSLSVLLVRDCRSSNLHFH